MMLGDYRLLAQYNTRHRYVILLLHDGGPEDLSLSAVAHFVASELSSRRAVDALPRWAWVPLLYGLVLPWRTPRTRKLYAASWLPPLPPSQTMGSSSSCSAWLGRAMERLLRVPRSATRAVDAARRQRPGASLSVYHCTELAGRMQRCIMDVYSGLREARGEPVRVGEVSIQVKVAFTHQQHSIDRVLNVVRLLGNYAGVCDSQTRIAQVEEEHLIVLPLYPQYSSVRSAAAFDALAQAAYLREQRSVPHLHFIRSYATHPAYVKALEVHTRSFLGAAGRAPPDWLFVVFDGVPRRHVLAGDVYESECMRTFDALKALLSQPYVSPSADAAGEHEAIAEADAASSTTSHTSRSTQHGSQLYTRPILSGRITMSFLSDPVGGEEALEPRTTRVLSALARQVRIIEAEACSASSTPCRVRGADIGHAEDCQSRTNRSAMLGTLYFVCPGIAIDDVRMQHLVCNRLVAQSTACGFDRAVVIPSMNGSELHAEMLATILAEYVR